MAELEVDPSTLKASAATFRDAGAEQLQVGAYDAAGIDADVAAFGEINAMLHGPWRDVKERQSQSWQGLGRQHDEHGDKLVTAANGYEGTDVVNAQSLGVVDE